MIKNDTIQIDSVSINPQRFKVLNAKLQIIPSQEYQVDFNKALLILNSNKYQRITVEYFRFPDFVTKTYSPFDENLIVPDGTNTGKLYSLTTNKKPSKIKLLDGLKTKGFISRGVISGNNQNTVTNSELDLEIAGKLSKDITLRANIFDTNIPLQQNGYSQNITDFDRVFIEMASKDWRVKAGDISLKNNKSYFMSFTKQASGIEAAATIDSVTKVKASAAIVRGRFDVSNFIGIEGNQGPYKLNGLIHNDPTIVIIEGSTGVFVNGIKIAPKNYTINHNLAEIEFSTTFPITNDMRISVGFQFSNRNYSRFVTYEEVSYKEDDLTLNGYFYSENDSKNQPLQQNLTENQKQILANAGNNQDLMFSESAFRDEYADTKILYKKVPQGAIEVFEYSTDSSAELYTVTFTNVGQNKGDYTIDRSTGIGTVFKYVGVNLGEYNPVIRLNAPSKIQVFSVQSIYNPSKKRRIDAELGFSNIDANLFSSIDDENNKAMALKVNWEEILIDNEEWKLKATIYDEFVQRNFNTERGLEPVGFNRDWNVNTTKPTRNLFRSIFNLQNKEGNSIVYQFHNLSYIDAYKGIKHLIRSKMNLKDVSFFADVSMLDNTSTTENNSFFTAKANVEYSYEKTWLGASVNFETNARKNKTTQEFIHLSHRFKEYQAYIGFGDSTKVFSKVGFNFRNNDSIRSNKFTEINNRKTLFVNSKLIQNKTTDLGVYANFKYTENAFTNNQKTLNSKIVLSQRLFDNLANLSTGYETSSGNVARQDYIYLKTEPGQGFYTWIDYNNDGVQDFNEFEIAQFQDQAIYLRVPKPNFRYIGTQRAKWNQSLTLNPSAWDVKNDFKEPLLPFYNESSLMIENEKERIGDSFHLNPFDLSENNLIRLNFSFRNSLYFNRNLQEHSVIYTYGTSRNKQQYFIGNQENKTKFYQLEYQHKLFTFWLLEFMAKTSENNLETENFDNRNYQITTQEIQPKVTFLYHKDYRFSAFYHLKNKKNKLQDFEKLQQHQLGLEYFYITKDKYQISANVNAFLNKFTGSTNTPVGYQMLEGLQAGRNYTWNLLFNKKLNSFLNLNLNYLGRKSQNSKTIHTGSIQLRAIF
ncbi:MAG: hypothetical protein ACPG44_04670 [Polaribacter sp.]